MLAGQQGQLGQAIGQFQQRQQGQMGQLGQISNFAAQRGAGLLGQDTGQVRQQELDLLRSQARPAEERAVNAKFQNLFSRGQLGTTGGANQIGALASAQENADIGRQLAATQTAQAQQAQNFATGQGLLGLGAQGRQLRYRTGPPRPRRAGQAGDGPNEPSGPPRRRPRDITDRRHRTATAV
jgi:hypothetical protein